MPMLFYYHISDNYVRFIEFQIFVPDHLAHKW